jgi:hypothetical protein
MRPRPGGGQLQPCNSARSLGGGRPSARPGRGRAASNAPAKGAAAAGAAAAGANNAANLYGGGGGGGGGLGAVHARVTMMATKRPAVRRERSAAAERFLPQILKRTPPAHAGGATAPLAAMLQRRETFSARFSKPAQYPADEREGGSGEEDGHPRGRFSARFASKLPSLHVE